MWQLAICLTLMFLSGIASGNSVA
uniref:Uncharacterized protein n=1 Tax=Anguilla anguilla TaxID=7936 RepID=A0A0E9RHU5_ANGAN